MKLHALRDSDSRHGKDLVDIRFLLDYIPAPYPKIACAPFANGSADRNPTVRSEKHE